MICQSGSAWPGALTAGWNSVRLRSELTITPSDSLHRAAGTNTSAYSLVSVCKNASWPITSSALSRPPSTVFRFATEAMGFVQTIQHALIWPSAMREKISMVPVPTSVRSDPRGMPHWSSTKARSSAEATERWPGKPGPR